MHWLQRWYIILPLLLTIVPVNLQPASAATVTQAADRAQINARAPVFPLPDLEGNEISLSSLRGKVVLLTFWSIWCTPCRQEMSLMDSLRQIYKDKGVEVIGVNIDRDSVASIQDFVRNHHLHFPILLDRERKVMKAYRAHFLPTTFLLDRGGIVVEKSVGVRDWSNPESQRLIEKLLR